MSATAHLNIVTRQLIDASRELIAKGANGMPGFDVSLFNDADRISLWAPFEVLAKGANDDPKLGYISGIATTEAPDADGDIVLTDGIDWSYFVGDKDNEGKGFLIDEHPVGNHNVVGYPISVATVQVPNGEEMVKGAKVKGALYLEDRRGAELYQKACTMKRAGGDRKLGFSIEGSVKPGGRRGKVVEKSQVKWLAITAAPKNELSWWEPVAKSLLNAAGHKLHKSDVSAKHVVDVASVVLENLSGSTSPDQMAEALVVRLLKSHQDMSWRDAVSVLQHVLRTVSSPNAPQSVRG